MRRAPAAGNGRGARALVDARLAPRARAPSRSHLQGMWHRTIKFLDSGIKPVYVFDGAAPKLKARGTRTRTHTHTHARTHAQRESAHSCRRGDDG